jgi:hypothetical protein
MLQALQEKIDERGRDNWRLTLDSEELAGMLEDEAEGESIEPQLAVALFKGLVDEDYVRGEYDPEPGANDLSQQRHGGAPSNTAARYPRFTAVIYALKDKGLIEIRESQTGALELTRRCAMLKALREIQKQEGRSDKGSIKLASDELAARVEQIQTKEGTESPSENALKGLSPWQTLRLFESLRHDGYVEGKPYWDTKQ